MGAEAEEGFDLAAGWTRRLSMWTAMATSRRARSASASSRRWGRGAFSLPRGEGDDSGWGLEASGEGSTGFEGMPTGRRARRGVG